MTAGKNGCSNDKIAYLRDMTREALLKIGYGFKIPSSPREKHGFAATGAAGPSLKPQATCGLSRIYQQRNLSASGGLARRHF
jgi:hypothetical protein